MLRALRSGLEQDLHTTEEIDAALATAKSIINNCHAGLRAHAQMSERACCV
jgi:hypothetical protein